MVHLRISDPSVRTLNSGVALAVGRSRCLGALAHPEGESAAAVVVVVVTAGHLRWVEESLVDNVVVVVVVVATVVHRRRRTEVSLGECHIGNNGTGKILKK